MMGNYIPSERVVRSMYNLGTQENLTRNGYYRTTENLSKEFDRFIREVRAEAWDEGATAAFKDASREEPDPNWSNPYRK